MSRIVNELDSIHFSIKKASKLVKEIGRQVKFLIIFLTSLFHITSNFLLFCPNLLCFSSSGCNWQVYYGNACHYCHRGDCHHHSEGMAECPLSSPMLICSENTCLHQPSRLDSHSFSWWICIFCVGYLSYHLFDWILFLQFTQLVNPNNKDIRDIPGLAPPAPTRKLLWMAN